eukprot:6192743-Pleurochrysis_carterae.AAC.2
MPSLGLLVRYFRLSCPMRRESRRDEEVVAETVDIDLDALLALAGEDERDDGALGAAAHRACQVERRCELPSRRQDERLELRQLGVHRIDPALKQRRLAIAVKRRACNSGRLAGARRRSNGAANVNQTGLHLAQLHVQLTEGRPRLGTHGANEADRRVQLIRVAEGGEDSVVLATTLAAKERRRAAIACARVHLKAACVHPKGTGIKKLGLRAEGQTDGALGRICNLDTLSRMMNGQLNPHYVRTYIPKQRPEAPVDTANRNPDGAGASACRPAGRACVRAADPLPCATRPVRAASRARARPPPRQ